MSRQILIYFFSGLFRSAVAAPLVEAQYVAAVGMLCEHSTEGAGGAVLLSSLRAKSGRDRKETIAMLNENNLGSFGWHRVIRIFAKVCKRQICNHWKHALIFAHRISRGHRKPKASSHPRNTFTIFNQAGQDSADEPCCRINRKRFVLRSQCAIDKA